MNLLEKTRIKKIYETTSIVKFLSILICGLIFFSNPKISLKYNINIIGMVNKSQGNFACNIIDVNGEFTEEQVREMEDFPGILRVMLIN